MRRSYIALTEVIARMPLVLHETRGQPLSVGAALLWTLEQGLGSGWTPEVKAAWSDAYALLADVMQAAAGAVMRSAPNPSSFRLPREKSLVRNCSANRSS